MLGKCFFVSSASLCVTSKHTWSKPCIFISLSMARATISRGARLRRSSYFCMNSSPEGSRNIPPYPRMASVIKYAGWVSPEWKRAVGWNWTNSMSLMIPLARCTIAMPSPVAMSGLVVVAYTAPIPPVAIRVIRLRKVSIFWVVGLRIYAP